MAAWDLGMGLVSAAACGVTGDELTYWVDGVKAEIDELNGGNWFDVLGLAGAIYGLAYVGEDYNPTGGEHVDSTSIADLAEVLAGYQLVGGGFTYNSANTNPAYAFIQETAYAILALNEINHAYYSNVILDAADFLIFAQLETGGWEQYIGGGVENNEITGEALWGIQTVYALSQPLHEVWVCPSGDCGHPGAGLNSIQAAINAVEPGGTVNVLPGTYNDPGGVLINKDGLKIILQDGVVVKNTSPCFTVDADYTRIMAESYAGAKCVPTNGWAGIEIMDGIHDLIIDKLEIDGSGERTAAGIYFYGGASDVQILNNYLHNLSADGLASTAIDYYGEITGVFDIQGNMFKDTAGIVDMGNFDTNATYNSWGAYEVLSSMVSYDVGFGNTIDFDPWTHVELFIEPAGEPWEDKVAVGEEISVLVTADMMNITGAAFVIEFDPALVQVKDIDNKDYFQWPFGVDGYEGDNLDANITVNNTEGWIAFGGVSLDPVSGEDFERIVLFEVTFDTMATGTVDLAFVEGTDSFAMNPPVEDPFSAPPSTHVYPLALNDGVFDIIALPTITSDDIQGYYLTGEPREFSVRTFNPTDGAAYTNVLFRYVIYDAVLADIESFTSAIGDMVLVQDDDNLVGYFGLDPLTGFAMHNNPYDVTTTFDIEFNTAKDYVFELTLVDLTTDPETVLATFTQTANVYDRPILTPDIPAIFMSGEETDFSVNLVNPLTGITTNVYAVITLTGVTPDQIESLTYFEIETGQFENLPFNYDEGTGTITIWFGPPAGFWIEPLYDIDALFKVIFDTDVSLYINYEVALYDYDFEPDRLLAVVDGSTVVYANFNVTGTVAMQGRTLRAGVPLTLTGQNFGYEETVISLDRISNNYTFPNVIADTYLFTTLQPRYLNVHPELGKFVQINAGQVTLPNLGLRGGNAIWENHPTSNNRIDIFDASAVGTAYNDLAMFPDADVNFDGKVNIQDLALVGGNFGLTAEAAYFGWLPISQLGWFTYPSTAPEYIESTSGWRARNPYS
jgi:hypothetical protein